MNHPVDARLTEVDEPALANPGATIYIDQLAKIAERLAVAVNALETKITPVLSVAEAPSRESIPRGMPEGSSPVNQSLLQLQWRLQDLAAHVEYLESRVLL